MHTFTFFYTDPGGQMTIDLASWEILHLEPALEELRIHTAQRVFDVIVGSGFLGRFVFLPDLKAGFAAADLTNADLSSDCLKGTLGSKDAAAVASALRDYVS